MKLCIIEFNNGDWALGIGHWGLGIGDWAWGMGHGELVIGKSMNLGMAAAITESIVLQTF